MSNYKDKFIILMLSKLQYAHIFCTFDTKQMRIFSFLLSHLGHIHAFIQVANVRADT